MRGESAYCDIERASWGNLCYNPTGIERFGGHSRGHRNLSMAQKGKKCSQQEEETYLRLVTRKFYRAKVPCAVPMLQGSRKGEREFVLSTDEGVAGG